MTEQRTHIAVVLDRSGSMQSIRDDAEGGLKAFLADQAEVPGLATVSLYQFDHEYEAVYESRDVRELPDFRLTPRGNTALLDAVGRTIAHVDAETAKDRPDQVVVVVVTDGQENSSREFTPAQCRELIEARERLGWKFVFLAADATAFAEGAAMSMPGARSMSSLKKDLGKSMRAAGKMVARGRSGGEYEFTDEERAEGGDRSS
jgi:uncharacterized protein YegL